MKKLEDFNAEKIELKNVYTISGGNSGSSLEKPHPNGDPNCCLIASDSFFDNNFNNRWDSNEGGNISNWRAVC